ncbi:hypothetical protein [Microbulbifer sp. ANSA005]|uniref:hypothetical protein n=1 Tax=Microbulbifer sp. ANSA005 TaxID=3243362 RepID=UPI004042F409
MKSAVKEFEKRESDVERKVVLFGVALLLILFAIGLGVLVNLFLLTPSTGLAVKLLSSIAVPTCVSAYVLHYCYRNYFVGLK